MGRHREVVPVSAAVAAPALEPRLCETAVQWSSGGDAVQAADLFLDHAAVPGIKKAAKEKVCGQKAR